MPMIEDLQNLLAHSQGILPYFIFAVFFSLVTTLFYQQRIESLEKKVKHQRAKLLQLAEKGKQAQEALTDAKKQLEKQGQKTGKKSGTKSIFDSKELLIKSHFR